MAVTQVQRVFASGSSVTTLSVTPTQGPTAGNLLVVGQYVGINDQSTGMSGPAGWTKAVNTALTTAGGWAWYWKVATGSEGTAALTFNSGANTNVFDLIFYEFSTGTAWATNPVATTGKGETASAATLTVTADAATTQADTFAIVGFGLSGTSGGFLNTWTNSFVQDYTDQRITVGTRTLTATGTPSTTETWTTARVPRGGMVVFNIPSPGSGTLQPPTGLTATPISSTAIDVTYTRASGATGEDIERNGDIIATGYTGSLPYHDTGLTASTTYTYRARSIA